MNHFAGDNNQQLKDMIREATETRRQRILKKLKDRIASSLFTPWKKLLRKDLKIWLVWTLKIVAQSNFEKNFSGI